MIQKNIWYISIQLPNMGQCIACKKQVIEKPVQVEKPVQAEKTDLFEKSILIEKSDSVEKPVTFNLTVVDVEDVYHTKELSENQFIELDKFTFDGTICKAKVVDTYDCDTVTIVFYWYGRPIKDSFRMYGYDSPEIKPLKSIENRDLHIRAGLHAKEFMKNLVLHKLVWIKFCKEEKYGRLMGNMYLIDPESTSYFKGTEVCVNQLMISNGLGKPYNGGHKKEFTVEELSKIMTIV